MMYPLIASPLPSALMPPAIAAAGAGILFVLAAAVLATHTMLTARAATRADLTERARWLAPMLVAAVLGAWLAIALVIADGTHFPIVPRVLRFRVTLAVMFVPFVLGLALLFASRTMRAINTAMPTSWLVRVQSYRLAGFIFLFPFLAYAVVPGGFAWPAAVGDMATGALALVVGHALEHGRPGAGRWAIAWNLFGMLDLIVVPLAALHYGAQVIAVYPLAIVPLFLGPPLGMLTHVYSLRNLLTARRAPASLGASTPHAAHSATATRGAALGSL